MAIIKKLIFTVILLCSFSVAFAQNNIPNEINVRLKEFLSIPIFPNTEDVLKKSYGNNLKLVSYENKVLEFNCDFYKNNIHVNKIVYDYNIKNDNTLLQSTYFYITINKTQLYTLLRSLLIEGYTISGLDFISDINVILQSFDDSNLGISCSIGNLLDINDDDNFFTTVVMFELNPTAYMKNNVLKYTQPNPFITNYDFKEISQKCFFNIPIFPNQDDMINYAKANNFSLNSINNNSVSFDCDKNIDTITIKDIKYNFEKKLGYKRETSFSINLTKKAFYKLFQDILLSGYTIDDQYYLQDTNCIVISCEDKKNGISCYISTPDLLTNNTIASFFYTPYLIEDNN